MREEASSDGRGVGLPTLREGRVPKAGPWSKLKEYAEAEQQKVSPSFIQNSSGFRGPQSPFFDLKTVQIIGTYKVHICLEHSRAPPASPGHCTGNFQPAQGKWGPQTSPRVLS